MTAKPDNWVALLGVKGGPAINPHGSMPSSHLLMFNGKTIVVDCGAGVAMGIVRQGVALKTIDAIFITHLHSDHYLDLGPLLHSAWTAGLKHHLIVYAPLGAADYWKHFIASMRFDIDTRMADEGRPDINDLITVQTLDAGVVTRLGNIKVSALRNLHPPLTESFSLRFDDGVSSVVFSGDTAYFPPLADFAEGANILIHEAMYPAGIDRLVARIGNGDDRLRKHMFASHTPVEDAGRIAKAAGVGALAINHMVPIDDPMISTDDWAAGARQYWNGPLHIGTDGLRVPF
jgi:ribonuclease BN (tRNA processing enzyme)